MWILLYQMVIIICSPLIYIPFVYFIFKDMEEVKLITFRIYLLLLVGNIIEFLFMGSNATPF